MVDSARHTRWRVPLRIIALLVIVGAMLMGVSPASAATKKLTATPKPTITGSTVVGKKLTDNLFIGYDHNFFDQKGEFRLSYNLGYGFSAVTRSSANSNGADIFYSIDK